VLGCIGEFFAEYTQVCTEDWRDALGKRSLILLILGLGLGLLSLIKTNALSGQIIASLGDHIKDVGGKVQEARDVSSAAATKAKDALGLSRSAEEVSRDALHLAQGAQSEASSAVSSASGAKKLAEDVELSVRKRAPRATLIRGANISTDARLQPFREQNVLLVSCMPAPLQTFPEAYSDPRRASVGVFGALAGLTDNPVEYERSETLRELHRQLSQAHWEPNVSITAGGCGGSAGTSIRFRIDPQASDETRQAARQLANVLHEALLFEGNTPQVTTIPLENSLPRESLPSAPYDRTRSFIVLIYNNPFQ